jgi:hypothetical protein
MGCCGRVVLCLFAGLALAQAQSSEAQAILKARCAPCHAGPQAQGGLRVDARSALLEGGRGGPAITPGDSGESLLIRRVTGAATPRMPMGGAPLPAAEIDAGAPFAAGTEARIWRPSLALARPPAAPAERPLDALLATYLRERGLPLPPPVSDALYARRVWFDLHGLPPAPDQLRAFLADRAPDKRARLVARLLADRKPFAEHWISFWNDLLHNDEGVTYIGDRKSITPYLLSALESNRPYDAFVRDLLNPAPEKGPAGFLLGVNWRGDISAAQAPVMQAAQNSAQVFLAVNLKCNSCHDSFISRWKLRDAYGLASFFSDQPLELVRCDVKTGVMASPRFLYPELGGVSAEASAAERREAAARLFTATANGRFPRVFVNRVWKRLLGRGLVEPVDDLDAEPWSADILDTLAYDFAARGYDITRLLAEILASRAYQAPAVEPREGEKSFVFRGPLRRRLTAEQFTDAVAAITGRWRVLASSRPGPGVYAREWRFKASSLSASLGRPQRDLAVTERYNDPTTLQALELVNGETLAGLLREGALRMLGRFPDPPAPLWDSGVVGAAPASADVDITGVAKLRLVAIDQDSYDATRVRAGWRDAVLEGPAGATPVERLVAGGAVKLQFRGEPAGEAVAAALPSEIVLDLAGRGFTRFRARAGVDQGSLASDIAPRVRFFAFDRTHDAGAPMGVHGAPPAPPARTPADPVERLFRHALARDPSPRERIEARRILGAGAAVDGLEDLLWSVFLSPEFQYLR